MMMRDAASRLKRCLIVFIGVSLMAWGGPLQAESPYVSGTVERIYSAGGHKFIQVGGRSFLINADTRLDIMRGKQLIENVPIRNLQRGSQVNVLVSEWEGKQWAKNILAYEREGDVPVKGEQILVPVVRPK